MQSPDQLPVLMPTATDRDSAAAEKMSDAADAKSTTLPDETVPEEKMSDGAADENTATPEETTGNTPKAPEVAAAAIAADTAQTSQSKVRMVMIDEHGRPKVQFTNHKTNAVRWADCRRQATGALLHRSSRFHELPPQ